MTQLISLSDLQAIIDADRSISSSITVGDGTQTEFSLFSHGFNTALSLIEAGVARLSKIEYGWQHPASIPLGVTVIGKFSTERRDGEKFFVHTACHCDPCSRNITTLLDDELDLVLVGWTHLPTERGFNG